MTAAPGVPPSYSKGARWTRTAAYCLSFVALGLVSASLGPTLPGLAVQTGVPLGLISTLFVGRSSGYLLGSLAGGRLYDRVPGHPVMAGVLGIMAAMMAAVPLATGLSLLISVLFVLGIAEGTLDVGGNTLLTRVHPTGLDPFMNGLHCSFGVGAFLSPLVVVRMMSAGGGIAWAYWALAIATLAAAASFLGLSSPAVRSVSRDGLVREPSRLMMALTAGCFFLFVGAEAGIGGWVFTYALKMNLADERGAGYLTSLFWGALTVGRLLAVPVSTRLGPRTILLGDLAGSFASVAAICVWPQSLAVLWVGTAGAGFFIASMFAAVLNLVGQHVTISGRVTGWFFVGSSTGGMTVPWLIGQVFESSGPPAGLRIVGVDLLLAAGVFLGLLVHLRKRWGTSEH